MSAGHYSYNPAARKSTSDRHTHGEKVRLQEQRTSSFKAAKMKDKDVTMSSIRKAVKIPTRISMPKLPRLPKRQLKSEQLSESISINNSTSSISNTSISNTHISSSEESKNSIIITVVLPSGQVTTRILQS